MTNILFVHQIGSKDTASRAEQLRTPETPAAALVLRRTRALQKFEHEQIIVIRTIEANVGEAQVQYVI